MMAVLFTVIVVIVCVVVGAVWLDLLAVIVSRITWRSTGVAVLYVVALVAGTGALLLFIQGMGWLGAWLS